MRDSEIMGIKSELEKRKSSEPLNITDTCRASWDLRRHLVNQFMFQMMTLRFSQALGPASAVVQVPRLPGFKSWLCYFLAE